MIESTLATLKNRILASIKSENTLHVLDDEVVNDASRLWREVLDASAGHSISFDVVNTIACLHWHRYNALPAGRDHDDLQVAAVMFALVQRVEPDLVPEPLRDMISNAGYLDFSDNVGVFPWGPSYSENRYPSSREVSISKNPTTLTRQANAIMEEMRSGGDLESLNEAVALMRQVVSVSPTTPAERAGYTSNLGRALLMRFERLKNHVDIDEAVTCCRGAVELARVDGPSQPSLLLNLGSSLGSRYLDGGDIADLNEAIVMFRHAVELACDSHPLRQIAIANLERALVTRFDKLGNRSDVLEAMSLSDKEE